MRALDHLVIKLRLFPIKGKVNMSKSNLAFSVLPANSNNNLTKLYRKTCSTQERLRTSLIHPENDPDLHLEDSLLSSKLVYI